MYFVTWYGIGCHWNLKMQNTKFEFGSENNPLGSTRSAYITSHAIHIKLFSQTRSISEQLEFECIRQHKEPDAIVFCKI